MVIHDLSQSDRLTINRGCREQSTFKICEVPETLFLPGNGRFGREFIYGSMAQKLNPILNLLLNVLLGTRK